MGEGFQTSPFDRIPVDAGEMPAEKLKDSDIVFSAGNFEFPGITRGEDRRRGCQYTVPASDLPELYWNVRMQG